MKTPTLEEISELVTFGRNKNGKLFVDWVGKAKLVGEAEEVVKAEFVGEAEKVVKAEKVGEAEEVFVAKWVGKADRVGKANWVGKAKNGRSNHNTKKLMSLWIKILK